MPKAGISVRLGQVAGKRMLKGNKPDGEGACGSPTGNAPLGRAFEQEGQRQALIKNSPKTLFSIPPRLPLS